LTTNRTLNILIDTDQPYDLKHFTPSAGVSARGNPFSLLSQGQRRSIPYSSPKSMVSSARLDAELSDHPNSLKYALPGMIAEENSPLAAPVNFHKAREPIGDSISSYAATPTIENKNTEECIYKILRLQILSVHLQASDYTVYPQSLKSFLKIIHTDSVTSQKIAAIHSLAATLLTAKSSSCCIAWFSKPKPLAPAVIDLCNFITQTAFDQNKVYPMASGKF
jgi:hypothetical protein